MTTYDTNWPRKHRRKCIVQDDITKFHEISHRLARGKMIVDRRIDLEYYGIRSLTHRASLGKILSIGETEQRAWTGFLHLMHNGLWLGSTDVMSEHYQKQGFECIKFEVTEIDQ